MKNWLAKFKPTPQGKHDLTLTPSLHHSAEAVELQQILELEQEVIAQRKAAAGSTETGVVGLALSGGGIRSATFCFGVLQVLERKGFMKHVDFLSTVSGGGYTGSAYSAWRLRQVLASKTPADIGYDTIHVRRSPPRAWDELLPHLRKFSNYLAPNLGLGSPGTWRILATMVRNLSIHWLSLIAAIALAFLALLIALRFLWALSAVFALGGSALIAVGLVREFSGRAFVRECQNGGSHGRLARLWRKLSVRLESQAMTPPWSYCRKLASEVQSLLQAPRLLIFIGLTLYALGAAIGFVFTTYPQYPRISDALPDSLPVGGLLHLVAPALIDPGFSIYTGTRFYAAAFLVLASIVVVSAIGFASEWRWRPRRDFRPRVAWIGFVLMAALFLIVWFSLAHYNGGLTPLAGAERVDLLDVFPRAVTWSLAGAWSYAWQAGVVLLLFTFMISITIAVFNDQMDREEREWSTRLVSVCLVAAVSWTGLAALVLGSAKLAQWVFVGASSEISGLGGAGVTGLWLTISTWIARLGKTEAASAVAAAPWKRVAIAIGPWFFIAGLIVVTCFATALLLLSLGAKFSPLDTLPPEFASRAVLWSGWYVFGLAMIVAVIFLVAGVILDPNEYSLHGFYRDRLVRSYLGASNGDTPAPDSIWNIRTDDVPLADTLAAVTEKNSGAPFQIVNTAVNLFGSKDLQVQQRCCDSFVLTPLACGSWATNYAVTPPRLYLGTALAISGAAVSSNAGLATRGAAIAALMTFFNMRLGYWFGNPRFTCVATRKRPKFAPSYLFAEALSATNEDRAFVNLSDGGHFDNMGIYELIRRRCRYIVLVDAECDPDYSFSSLAEVIRMARIDFDVQIQIDTQAVAPKPGERYAQRHWALGKILYKDPARSADGANSDYPDRGLRDSGESDGHLLYIKSSLLGPERSHHISADIVEYARRHNDFPHDSTADQFFNEQQFESYRKLGECIASEMLARLPAAYDAKSVFEYLERTMGQAQEKT